jgi:replicative DNA helicase
VVVFIHREEAYYKTEDDWNREHMGEDYPRGIADIIIAKNRNGPTNAIKVRFQNTFTRFENLSAGEPSLI